jgi:hypothetical protein
MIFHILDKLRHDILKNIRIQGNLDTHIDASDHQLGAVIMQDKKQTAIALYSRKLNTSQKRYTTTERELLSAIETCKEYKNILLGYHWPTIVFTDHKNDTFNGLKASDLVSRACWLLLLEEYGVTFEYLSWMKNVASSEQTGIEYKKTGHYQ